MMSRIFFFVYLSLSFKYSAATTIISSKDGNWEDSTSWNGYAIKDTISNDSLIIRNHLSFNSDLLIQNCYVELDSGGSICGHYTIHFLHSFLLQDGGGLYAYTVMQESSQWQANDGRFQEIVGGIMWGTGSWFRAFATDSTDFLFGFVGGDFICTNPVQSWRDSTQTETTQNDSTLIPPAKPPLSINVYPNPSLDHFIIDSEIPDSNSLVILNIYDFLGIKMKSISIPSGKSALTIFTNNWVAGMYLLRFEQGETIIETDKIVRVQ